MIFLWIITQLLTRFAIDFSPNEVMNTDGMNVTFVLPHWQDYTLSLTQVNKRWLATVFIKKIALDEESYQNLILAVDLHRKKYAMNSKKDLKKFFSTTSNIKVTENGRGRGVVQGEGVVGFT